MSEIDLIEIQVVGGPWTSAEAEEIGGIAAGILIRQLRREVSKQTDIRQPINIESAYCSDVRGEETAVPK